LCFNKECIYWQKGFETIKMHGKTTIKKKGFLCHGGAEWRGHFTLSRLKLTRMTSYRAANTLRRP
jgi:hypothetical protein